MSSSSAKQRGSQREGLLASMLQAGLYKPQQGRVVRQVTFVGAEVLLLLIAWEIGRITYFQDLGSGVPMLVTGILALLGTWFAYRIVNHPPFADFLVAVEAEMKKVSWPAWPQLWKASLVVIFVIFSMALSLWLFDLFWTVVFQQLGIR